MSREPVQRSVAVVGAGMAGLACAGALRDAGHAVRLFDKSRGPSGRAATRRGEGWACDHGAQYFTADDPQFAAEVRRWCEAGVAAEWTPRLRVFGDAAPGSRRDGPTRRFVGVPAMTAPARWLAAGQQLLLQHTIDRLRRDDDGWQLRSAEHGWLDQVFDAVLLALPAPQARALLGGVHARLEALAASAPMQACWSVIAVYDDDPLPQLDAAFVNQPLLSWICADHRKPGRAGAPCWLLHAQPAWSQEHLEAEPPWVVQQMLGAFAELGARGVPRHAFAHRWRYARGALADAPAAAWDPAAGLGLCGDWLCCGRVEGAWRSGRALAGEVLAHAPRAPLAG
jgi:predicted NAD/FAD-dependent oxidoreductase